MSLVSRTPSDLFATLLSCGNPEVVALNFVQKHRNDPTNMNVQLTDLIFRCCGISLVVNLPYELVRAEDVPAIVNIVESVSPSSNSTSNSAPGFTLHKKCFDKALKFFESFWFLYWCNNPDENGYFIKKLILALSKVDVCAIQFFCLRILSKFITSLWKNNASMSEQQIMETCQLVRKVMVGSFMMKNRQFLKKSLLEFEQWLLLRPDELLDDNFLCFIVWSLKESTINIVLTSLDILEGIISNHDDIPKRFLQQCGEAFSVMAITANDEIFARVCDCCSKIQSKFQGISYDNIERKLTEHLFSYFDENKKEAAATYWLSLNYDANNVSYSIRNAINCINSFSFGLKHVEYFIDSIIDKCPELFTQWDIFALLLVDKFEEKLSNSEKDTLLVIIVYAAQRTVMNTKPSPCSEDCDEESTHDEDTENIRRSITLAFVPHLEYIFQLPYIEPALLLKLMIFFNFDYTPVSLQKHLIKCCVRTFEVVDKVLMRRIAIELLWKMKLDSNDDLSEICLQTIKELRNTFEDQAGNAFNDLLENPDDYRNTQKGEEVKKTFLALHFINVVVPVHKKIAYDAAIKIMKEDLPALWNPAFMAVREVCLILSATYILRKLRKDESFEKQSQNVTDARNLILYFSMQLKKAFDRSGMVIFCSLCDIAILFHEKNAIDLFSKVVFQYMNLYFRTVLNQSDEKNNALSDINKCLMKKYLELIDLDILPMEYAYDALSIYCHQDHLQYDRILYEFIKLQSEKRGTDFMVTWMTQLWTRIYEGNAKNSKNKGENLTSIFEKLRNLIYSLRLKIANFVNKCHLVGIDYATSEAEHIEFARILAVFSSCLSTSNRSLVLNYALSKASNAPAMQLYIRSLKTRENLKIHIGESPAQGSSTTSSRASSVDIDKFSVRDSSGSLIEDVLYTISSGKFRNSEFEAGNFEGSSSVSRFDLSEHSNSSRNGERESMEVEQF